MYDHHKQHLGGSRLFEQYPRSKSDLPKNKIPFFLDACRFVKNAYSSSFEKGPRKPHGQRNRPGVFSTGWRATMSGKKRRSRQHGGFCSQRRQMADKARNFSFWRKIPLTAAWAARPRSVPIGSKKFFKKIIWKYRSKCSIQQVKNSRPAEFPSCCPPVSCVYLERSSVFATYSSWAVPGQALSCALYQAGESEALKWYVMLGSGSRPTKLWRAWTGPPRFAPSVYTQSHIDYACEIIIDVLKREIKFLAWKWPTRLPPCVTSRPDLSPSNDRRNSHALTDIALSAGTFFFGTHRGTEKIRAHMDCLFLMLATAAAWAIYHGTVRFHTNEFKPMVSAPCGQSFYF